MTRQRNDSHSTEFGIWLRVQPQIDSSLGFLASNIDYCWTNYKTGEWMFIEEKRYNTAIKYCLKITTRHYVLVALTGLEMIINNVRLS